MSVFKRIGFFLLTNIAIMVTISIILNITGVGRYITATGIDYKALLVFCLIWGMTGSFISLLLSKTMAKWSMGVKVINPGTIGGVEGDLVQMVRRISTAARVPMPEVGIYESPEPNAFATGPTKKNSLIAVSTGLLNSMKRNEVEGVIGHEMAHISNGDMVTMVLIQGVVNAFAMFLSRIISYFVSTMVKEDLEYLVRIVLTIVLDIIFSIIGSLVVAAFSRQREFRADLGGARFAGKGNMIAALQALQSTINAPVDHRGESMASLKISNRKKGFLHLFSTHPSLETRIAALERARV
ncbi:MAG TPA: protease HtpX [Spirochaetota bacterium]|nr:protease HtpX [Spirochaetota bacterium]